MAWSPDELAAAKQALLTALTSGKIVKFAEREWTSHDIPELRALIADMERGVATTTTGRAYRLAATSKGL